MVPEEWPIASSPPTGAPHPARHAHRGRLPVVQQDFFLDPEKRLSEQERALMTAMLADLIDSVADELRALIPDDDGGVSDADGHQLLVQLGKGRLLDHQALIGLLLRRADEERIQAAMRVRSPGHPAFLQALVGDPDGLISAAAMSVVLARGARRDRLGQPRVQFDDVPAREAAILVYTVAAAIRPGAALDGPLADAAEALLARRDPARSVGWLTAQLTGILDESDRLGDVLLKAAAEEGDVSFLAAALGRRAGIAPDEAWELLVDGGDGRLMLLLRMASASRQLAGMVLGLLGDLFGLDDAGSEIARFDSLDDDEVDRQRIALRMHPAYHDTIRALADHG